MRVDVAPVEAEVDPVDGAAERLWAMRAGRIVEAEEADRAVGLVHVRRARRDVRDLPAADRGAGEHDSVDGAVSRERLGPRAVLSPCARGPAVRALELVHRQAPAVVE